MPFLTTFLIPKSRAKEKKISTKMSDTPILATDRATRLKNVKRLGTCLIETTTQMVVEILALAAVLLDTVTPSERLITIRP